MHLEKRNNTVLTQGCHSPKFLWGIFRVRNERGMKQLEKYEEDPRQQPSGMTTYLNNTPLIRPYGVPSPSRGKDTIYSPRPRGRGWHVMPGEGGCFHGFTLIELLVVILIIGILAAIAVPQYQKAVERSRATEDISALQSLRQAYELYYLQNGTYAHKFADLDIQIPWQGNTKFLNNQQTDTKSNDAWSLEIEDRGGYVGLHIARIAGKYKGAGFATGYRSMASNSPLYETVCFERKGAARVLFDSNLAAGAYCEQIIHGNLKFEDAATRAYSLP